MFKKLIMCVVFALCFNCALAKELKIFVLDLQGTMEKSVAFNDLKKQIEEKALQYKRAAEAKESTLRQSYKDLESKKPILSKTAFDKQNDALRKSTEEFQQNIYSERGHIDRAYADGIMGIEKALSQIVSEEAGKLNADFVFLREQTLYSNKEYDITERIITLLNERLQKVKVSFEAKAETTPNKKS